jgi:hypothetical protein
MDNESDTPCPTANPPLAPTPLSTAAGDLHAVSPTAVGWVGLGDQGAPMARAIAEAGFELHVWVRRPQSLQALHELSYVVHDTLAEPGEASEAVGPCLRVDSDITDVMVDGGLLERLKPGSVIVNHGKGLPGFANDLYWRAAVRSPGVVTPRISARAMEGRAGPIRGCPPGVGRTGRVNLGLARGEHPAQYGRALRTRQPTECPVRHGGPPAADR